MICFDLHHAVFVFAFFTLAVVGMFWLQHRLDRRRRDRKYGKDRL